MGSQKRRSSPAYKRVHESPRERASVLKAPKSTRKSPKWSEEENDRLKEMRSKGLNWQDVEETGFFGDKSGNACRKRYERLLEKAKEEQECNVISLEELSQAYMEVRKEMWSIVAQKLGIKTWEVSEKRVFEWGLLTIKGLAREHRQKLEESQSQEHSQATGATYVPGLQTPPLTDEEDMRCGQNGELPSRDTTPNQQASPVPSSQHGQAFRSMYYNHPQSLPMVPDPPAYAVTSRHPSQLPQHLHFQHSPPLTLPAMQSNGYEPPHLNRPMLQAADYSMTLRFTGPPTSHPYERHAMPNPPYHQQLTPPTRHEEFSGPKMSVQSILSEPSEPQQPYT